MLSLTQSQKQRALFILVCFHIFIIAASNYLVQIPVEIVGLNKSDFDFKETEIGAQGKIFFNDHLYGQVDVTHLNSADLESETKAMLTLGWKF